ncbi:MAG: MFS transporter [Gammaproteobacteria bacterium]|nr:MFS transporter [Gammaproteobacteria bacterium]MBU1466937.1 MFS transporter [Gammaproteobacteria bacterium]MBU2318578.1 MFS transporter [Gammaproteobacteria bacterium]MBU2412737.1 MFS transporter [Gammaproteobacteria bacterium]
MDTMKRLHKLAQHDAAFLLLFIFLVALSLRGPVTGLPPLLDRISTDLNLSSSQSGLLTSLPLLAFGFFAPVASWLTRHFRIERILASGVGLIAIGMIIRTFGSISTLYIGAVFIGAGIAIGNVLLPSLLKREFPNYVVQLTAIYVLMMSIGGFLMSSLAVPLSLYAEQPSFNLPMSGWSFALACQSLLILLPLVVWFSCKITQHQPPQTGNVEIPTSVWRSITAWQVAGFLAVNSLVNYVVVAWVPAILMNNGYTDSTAGLYQGYLQLAGAIPSLILAPFINRLGSHRRLCLFATSLTTLSLAGFLFIPSWSGVWSVSFGFGVSMGFILGLSFVSLRTNSPKQAAALSGMAQLIGYTLAAIGPVLIGALYDWQQSWTASLYVMLSIGVIWMGLGWMASPKPDR